MYFTDRFYWHAPATSFNTVKYPGNSRLLIPHPTFQIVTDENIKRDEAPQEGLCGSALHKVILSLRPRQINVLILVSRPPA